MSKYQVHGVFNSHTEAGQAIPALQNSGLFSSQFSIIGQDGDAFRAATATLQSRKVPRLFFSLGLAGAVAGCLAGFFGMPHIPNREAMFLLMVPLSAAFVGTAIGLFTGMAIAAVLQLDDLPPSEAEVLLGDVHAGDVAISVNVANVQERDTAQRLMWEFGALHVAVDNVADDVSTAPRSIEATHVLQKTA